TIFKQLPATYSYHCLTDRRDRDLQRKINAHDLNDIMSLSVAIPYCDVVCGEKMFISLAKNTKLDKLYNTKLLSKLHQLNQI
ncbi:unnamed protein product, partial [marine sediment metagenome]